VATNDLKEPVSLSVFRLPTWLKERLYAEAERRGGGPSRLVAAALEQFFLLSPEQTRSFADKVEEGRKTCEA
jgi:hypothetical protein